MKLRSLKDKETFQTLEIWIGQNATRYHNFNTLPHVLLDALLTFILSLKWIGHNAIHYHDFHVLLHALRYFFSQFSIVCGYFHNVTTCHHQIYDIYIYIIYIHIYIYIYIYIIIIFTN